MRLYKGDPDFCIREYGHCGQHEFANGDTRD